MFKSVLLLLLLLTNFMCVRPPVHHDVTKLTQKEKEFIPYQKGQKFILREKSNTSLQSTLTVTGRVISEDASSKTSIPFYREKLDVNLEGTAPFWNINMNILARSYYLEINIDDYHFGLNFENNPTPTYSSIEINGITYNDVFEITCNNIDPNIIQPEKILYNKSKGILQISLTNDKNYQIVP